MVSDLEASGISKFRKISLRGICSVTHANVCNLHLFTTAKVMDVQYIVKNVSVMETGKCYSLDPIIWFRTLKLAHCSLVTVGYFATGQKSKSTYHASNHRCQTNTIMSCSILNSLVLGFIVFNFICLLCFYYLLHAD